MLARNYLDAKQLGITEIERNSLIEVLHRMERGELVSFVDSGNIAQTNTIYMPTFITTPCPLTSEKANCGTIGCLAGWANIISNGEAFPEIESFTPTSVIAQHLQDRLPKALCSVFGIDHLIDHLLNVSTETLANDLREYLTTGNIDDYET
jgi:hypothetical protein